MLSIILFFGLSQVIEAVTTIVFGTSERSIQSAARPRRRRGRRLVRRHKVESGPVDLSARLFRRHG